MRNFTFTTLATSLLLLSIAIPTYSAPINYNFTGNLIPFIATDLSPHFKIGDSISGTIVYDRDTVGLGVIPNNWVDTYNTGAVSISINGMDYFYNESKSGVFNDVYQTLGVYERGFTDLFNIRSIGFGSVSTEQYNLLGFDDITFSLDFGSQLDADLLTDVALPDLTELLASEHLETAIGRLTFWNPPDSDGGQVRFGSFFRFEINSVTTTPVPEPSTFLLLGGGLAGLVFVVRRRKKV